MFENSTVMYQLYIVTPAKRLYTTSKSMEQL